MLKIPKTFDCVQMKWNIQQQLAQEFVGMSEEEIQRQMNERINADPILGPFLKQIQATSRTDKRCSTACSPTS